MHHNPINLTDAALEEGREALFQLEQHLKGRSSISSQVMEEEKKSSSFDAASLITSPQNYNNRKMLDQVPRNARLHQRLESLGLTIEELDDRGLIDGGGSLPGSQYSSVRSRSRRSLELQPRSHRLQERGKEAVVKILNGLFHMLRILHRKGLDLKKHCMKYSSDNESMSKKQFFNMISDIGLPLSQREITDICNYYISATNRTNNGDDRKSIENESNSNLSYDRIGYYHLLRDARISIRGGKETVKLSNDSSRQTDYDELDDILVIEDTEDDFREAKSFTKVFADVKRMLLDATKRLNKHQDDVYRMFARWDTQGLGTVTATQFLRVLARLHVELSDQEQDLIVELLDTNAMGRIDFESLLNFCYGNNETASMENGILSPNSLKTGVKSGNGEDFTGNETLSAVSIGTKDSTSQGNRDPKGRNLQRPHTAAISMSRPYAESFNSIGPNVMAKSLSMSGKAFDQYNSNTGNVSKGDDHRRATHSSGKSSGPSFPHGKSYASADEIIEVDNDGEEIDLLADDMDYIFEDLNEKIKVGVANQKSNNEFFKPHGQTLEPLEHLVLLANQILTTLRDILMTRYRRGKSLQEIFQHFDRDNKGFFDCKDFVIATADLRLETSTKVGGIAVTQIAIDGYDKVSYGEFKVFVLDSDHKLLEMNIQEQLAQLLERHGKDYVKWMLDVFWNEEDILNDDNERKSRQFIQSKAFANALNKIGTVLTASEVNRLVDRFDVHGRGYCSLERFMRMIQSSAAWTNAEEVLHYQEEAIKEAEYLRKNHNIINGKQVPEELINMCEYLGIRVLTDENMLWIAVDALKAPLPISWTAQKDSQGRTYFYNHLTNQSKWEHPLDPHFRKLRDNYRQGNIGQDGDTSDMKNFHIDSRINLNNSNPSLFNRSLSNKQMSRFDLEGDHQAHPDHPIDWKEFPIPMVSNHQSNRPRSAIQERISILSNYSNPTNKPRGTTATRPDSAPNRFVVSNNNNNNEFKLHDLSTHKASYEQALTDLYTNRNDFIGSKTSINPKPKSRPSSSKRGTQQPLPTYLSTVDRAVNYGKVVPNYLLSKGATEVQKESNASSHPSTTNPKLAEMLEGNIIERLDNIIIAKSYPEVSRKARPSDTTAVSSSHNPSSAVDNTHKLKLSKSNKDGKGGIVIV